MATPYHNIVLPKTKRQRKHHFEILRFQAFEDWSLANFEASRSAACLRNAVSYGEKDLLHLGPELFSIDGTAAVAVELVEDGIVELGELFGRGGHVDPKVALDEPHRLESFPELSSGENTVLVQI
ncbi:hypothetical protein G4B88_027584 [Cannabis sativa]|uniref:Uncharacterized protein n=1 Tax=Cannabis sativa TaxID=3483 RepID=A0A7J6HRS1_CANSA|nr:hypothetical protein G4B88_027584 [Cannabis sativa]